MIYLNLEMIKKHLNIDSYFTDDDAYLFQLGDVAEQVVEKHIDDSLIKIAEDNGGVLPTPLLHAMLLFVGDMYQTRESKTYGSVQEVPFSYEYICNLYRRYKPRE